ncbi:hypothetical protein [Streptomyces regalis]|uniref:Uncharacterized protein n=1 Tax=Streptomyces regalis TaxID=68262 RepID=A0A101J720_9ACTN|nr:hypothetical protein [Streptomyces regalis]KUL21380.1 hypothetical protein ADL12_44940 [Streptomyces regalis]
MPSFDKTKIFPHAYRHTCAQRHADSGVWASGTVDGHAIPRITWWSGSGAVAAVVEVRGSAEEALLTADEQTYGRTS